MAEAIANPTIAALRAATAPGVIAPQGPQALSFPWMRAATTMSRAPSTPTRSTAQSAKSAPPVNPPASQSPLQPAVINPTDPYARFRNDPTAVLPGGGGMAVPSVPPITSTVTPSVVPPGSPPTAPAPPTAPDPVVQPPPTDPTNDPGMNDFNWDSWFDTDVAQPTAPAQPSQSTVVQPPPSNPIADPSFDSFDWSSSLPAEPTQPTPQMPTQDPYPYAFNWDDVSFLGLDPSVFMVPGATLSEPTPAPQPTVQDPVQYQAPDVPWWYFDQAMIP